MFVCLLIHQRITGRCNVLHKVASPQTLKADYNVVSQDAVFMGWTVLIQMYAYKFYVCSTVNEVQLQLFRAKQCFGAREIQTLCPPMRLVLWWHWEGQRISPLSHSKPVCQTVYRLVAQVEVKRTEAPLDRVPLEIYTTLTLSNRIYTSLHS